MSSQSKMFRATGDLAGGESSTSAWRAAEVEPSANVVPPAADPVSAAIGARFSAYTQIYPMISARLVAVANGFRSIN
jgi:PE family